MARAPELVGVAVAHAASCALTLVLGFDHVSDDDFARVTIAQSFAHAPKLDPTGTSWLPFPFWALGSAMMAVGRSLEAARATSIVFASLAVTVLYVALRTVGITRGRALLGVAFATLSPWSAWLGAATVPESFTASLTAAAAIGLGGAATSAGDGLPRARVWWLEVGFALALFAACLSRYEVWPVAAVLGVVLALRALRSAPPSARATIALKRRGLELSVAVLVALAPLLWMAWNSHAHGDALHFFQRVSRFKRAIGEGSTDTLSALLLYPRLLVGMRPDVLVASLVALVAARVFVTTSAHEVRQRWQVPLLCAGAQVAFLAYGNARDGAPAHHSERALLGVVFLMATFAADVIGQAAPPALSRARPAALVVALVLGGAWLATTTVALREVPGTTSADGRRPQLLTGRTLRSEHAEHLDLTPSAYEHFA